MEKDLESIAGVMSVDRTNELFESSIKRGEALSEKPYDETSIKTQKVVLGFGNLHINTARMKLGALRLLGYRNSLNDTKRAVERKVRDSQRP